MGRTLSSFPDVTFKINGQPFILTPLQYMVILKFGRKNYACYSIFVPVNINDSRGELFWILGNYFLFRFYSVFDLENNRVGFARSIAYNWTQRYDSVLFAGNPSVCSASSSISNSLMTMNIISVAGTLTSKLILSLMILCNNIFLFSSRSLQ